MEDCPPLSHAAAADERQPRSSASMTVNCVSAWNGGTCRGNVRDLSQPRLLPNATPTKIECTGVAAANKENISARAKVISQTAKWMLGRSPEERQMNE